MDAKSTDPPLLSIDSVASAASRVFSDPSRSEAEKTRKEIGSRSWPSTVAISPEGWVVGPYSRPGAGGRGCASRFALAIAITGVRMVATDVMVFVGVDLDVAVEALRARILEQRVAASAPSGRRFGRLRRWLTP
jgi:hypothetical protein